MNDASPTFVEETRIGFRFLCRFTWQHHVLGVAISELKRLWGELVPQGGVMLDVGCGQGKSFRLLQDAFAPQYIIGQDADPLRLEMAHNKVKKERINANLITGERARIVLPDHSIDNGFSHQTAHHLVEQQRALAEFWRVLKPGGVLLFAESTKACIDSWVIRWFFRHPIYEQKSADGYWQMLRQQGLAFEPQQVSLPYLWWSRARDFGLLKRWHIKRPPAPGQRTETPVDVAARKPGAA